MSKALLDTDMLSEILKGRNEVVLARERTYLAESGTYALSMISVVEIVKGLQKLGRERRIQTIMSEFHSADIRTLDLRSSELAGRIYGDLERTGQTIGLADPMIAAIAMRHGLTLVTGNVAHYQRIQGMGYPLRLDNWRNPVPLS